MNSLYEMMFIRNIQFQIGENNDYRQESDRSNYFKILQDKPVIINKMISEIIKLNKEHEITCMKTIIWDK